MLDRILGLLSPQHLAQPQASAPAGAVAGTTPGAAGPAAASAGAESGVGGAAGAAAGAAAPGIVGPRGSNPVHVRLLAINDLHGQLGDSDAREGSVGIGGSATLAAYIARERAQNPNGTILLSSGDAFGAAPPESTLLDHESTMAVLAGMGVNVATPGNHEFDRGLRELLRLITGGERPEAARSRRRRKAGRGAGSGDGAGSSSAPVAAVAPKWPGSPFPWVSANIVDAKTRKPVFPPYVIMQVNGVKVAFVGAVTKNLKNVTVAAGIRGIEALDPAEAINRYVPELQAKGVRAIVAFMHEGGDVDAKSGALGGPIADIAKRLHPEVDVVMTAHSHKEYATRLHGKLVAQAGSYAKALAAVDLAVDPASGQVVAGSARLVRNDEKGIAPEPTIDALVKAFKAAVAPRTERVVSVLPGAVTREKSAAGEMPIGTLIAEAQRRFAKADVALMNPGGIRQDIAAGPATWGKLFSVQPFGNRVMRMRMTGTQLKRVLEQMFPAAGKPTLLQVAGMRVHLDLRKPPGSRIAKVVMDDGSTLDPHKTYVVAANSFISDGGDGLTELRKVRGKQDVGVDLDALVAYLEAGLPVPTKPVGRLRLVGGKLPEHTH